MRPSLVTLMALYETIACYMRLPPWLSVRPSLGIPSWLSMRPSLVTLMALCETIACYTLMALYEPSLVTLMALYETIACYMYLHPSLSFRPSLAIPSWLSMRPSLATFMALCETIAWYTLMALYETIACYPLGSLRNQRFLPT